MKNYTEEKVMKCKGENYNPCAENKEIGRTHKMICEICGRTFYDHEGGRNPDPLRYNSCCAVCDEFIVMPARMMIMEVTRAVKEGRGKELEEVLAEKYRKREEEYMKRLDEEME